MRAESTFARRAINNDSWYDPPEARGASESVSGEAVVLEVAPGKCLFALLKGLPGWLPDYYDQRLDGSRIGTIRAKDRFANELASGAFDTGKAR